MMKKLQIVVLAAGHGMRMKSDLPKILHHLGGRPVLHYVLDLAHRMTPQELVLVVSPSLKDIQTPFAHKTVVQHPAQGTGDAVKWALPYLKPEGYVLILASDTPLIRKKTLERMLSLAYDYPETAVILLGMRPKDKKNYGRLVLNEEGGLEEVIEDKDLSSAQKDIPLCNSGVVLVRGDLLNPLLSALTANNANKEYYLPDLVKISRQKGYVCAVIEGETSEFLGINTRQDLAQAENFLQKQWRNQAMEEGATLIDPKTIYFSYDTKLATDVKLHPFVVLGPGVDIEKGAEILSFCKLSNAHIGPYAIVGPFAHLRDKVHLAEKAEIGNFVEVKKSTFGSKAKAKHLSYIGDAYIGSKANIGAGTITCNYDGFSKSKTQIGEGAFIGSNSSLVAPLSIGDYAVVGAGSVITQDVESRALTIARSHQKNLKEGADKLRQKRSQRKDFN
ncbi:MAG: bifunctional UDP-N-acetylglucosamine diphosphorylase/glucosamine-1-phosphate N-acetyltransferase GlmU [Alphaproteobacteria bacterium]|nr:bifunctional UDP-N-acetylglucosamine diphosphorylase/glucosamine-1-phosphate N-acetyltransferase GlmU [Alphaproteobacteria bacterium]